MPEETKKQVINESFKGEVITAADLPKIRTGVCIQRLVPKEDRPKINNFTSCKLPQITILEKVENGPAGTNSKYVHYVTTAKDTYKRGATHVPNDMPLKVLTGNLGKERMEKFEIHRTTNLDQYVSNIGMTIGTDPEIFIVNGRNEVIPAFDIFPSQKKAIADPNTGTKVFNDGFAAEWETVSGTCLAYLCDSTQKGMARIYKDARKKHKNAKLTNTTVIELDKEYLSTLTEEQAELGCAPSLNIYGLKGNIQTSGREVPFRCTGGHMHFGVGKLNDDAVTEIIKSLDNILAIACVSLGADYDNPIRRQYYGLPGEYRLPKHGIEYRTISNIWLIHPALMHLVFDLGRKTLSFGFNGLRKYWKGSEEETIEIVTNCDVKAARKVMELNKAIYLGLFKAAYRSDGKHELAYNVFYKGINEVIADPDNYVKNWSLNGGWVNHSGGESKCWHTASVKLATGKKL